MKIQIHGKNCWFYSGVEDPLFGLNSVISSNSSPSPFMASPRPVLTFFGGKKLQFFRYLFPFN